MWVYLKVKQQDDYLYTVGFYAPDGKFMAVADHKNASEAEEHVHYLNGGEK